MTLSDEESSAILYATGHLGPEASQDEQALHVLTCPTCSAALKTALRIIEAREGPVDPGATREAFEKILRDRTYDRHAYDEETFGELLDDLTDAALVQVLTRSGYGCTVCGRGDRVLHPAAWWVTNANGRRIGESVVRGSFCSYLCFEVWALAVERDQLSDHPCRDCGAPMTTDGRCLLLVKHTMEEA